MEKFLITTFFVLQLRESLVSSICTRGINYRGHKRGLLTCYPDTDLAIAKQLMEAKGIKQLPVVNRGVDFKEERKRRLIAVLFYDSIWSCIRSRSFSLFYFLFLKPLIFRNK